MTAAQAMDAAKLVNAHGLDSRYGKIFQQLQRRKLCLRHMLFYCYCVLGDESAGILMDTTLFTAVPTTAQSR